MVFRADEALGHKGNKGALITLHQSFSTDKKESGT